MKNKYVSAYKSKKWKIELLKYYDNILQNWPIPFEEMEVETLTAKTYILKCGNPEGKPLFFFHGTGNNSLMWRYNVEGLGKKYQLHLIDTPNDPGKSSVSLSFKPPEGYTQWVRELIESLGFDKVSVVGHSKGGWLALNTIISLPEKIYKAVLLAPAAGLVSKLNPEFLKKSLKVGLFPNEKNVIEYLKYMYGGEREINLDYAKYLSKLIKGTKSKPIAHREFTDDELQAIKSPVFLMFGEHERCIDYNKAIMRANVNIRNLRTKIIDGTGHALQGERPEEINKLIVDFI